MKGVLIMNRVNECKQNDYMISKSSLKPMIDFVYHEFENRPIT